MGESDTNDSEAGENADEMAAANEYFRSERRFSDSSSEDDFGFAAKKKQPTFPRFDQEGNENDKMDRF